MSEMSQHAKLIKAIEIAKVAQVGIELSYFDVLEVAGELNEAKEVVAMLNARIAELEAEKCVLVDQQREVKNILIDKKLHIDSLYEEGYKLQQRIAELEDWAYNNFETNNGKDSPNDTQIDALVYGKDSKPLPCPFCGEIVKECNDVATPIDVALRKRIAELEGKIDQLTARWRQERQDDRWIPVSERLPEEGHKVLVLLTDGAISIDLIYGNDFLYENWVGDITHWMPLPKLPEVQE